MITVKDFILSFHISKDKHLYFGSTMLITFGAVTRMKNSFFSKDKHLYFGSTMPITFGAVTRMKNSSFKTREHIPKKEQGPYIEGWANQASSVTLKLADK